jgi:hypothetical protein
LPAEFRFWSFRSNTTAPVPVRAPVTSKVPPTAPPKAISVPLLATPLAIVP